MPNNKPTEPIKRLLPPGVPPLTVIHSPDVRVAGDVPVWNGRAWELVNLVDQITANSTGGGGSGTVTSVAMTVPTGFTISGSPITGSGTLAVGLTGIDASKITSGTMATDRLGSGTANSSKILYGDSTWGDPPSGGAVSFADITTGVNTTADMTVGPGAVMRFYDDACQFMDASGDRSCELVFADAGPGSYGFTVTLPSITGTIIVDAGAQTITGSKSFSASQSFQSHIDITSISAPSSPSSGSRRMYTDSGNSDRLTIKRSDGTTTVLEDGGWTYVKLGSDFVTSSATAVAVTGMSFTPEANKQYEVRGQFWLRTATTTVGPRPGVAWPTGLTDGVAELRCTSAAGTNVLQNGNINAAVLGPIGGLPNTTQSWPGAVTASFLAGGTPSGTFKIQLASETGGTNVTMKAGSWIRYRVIP